MKLKIGIEEEEFEDIETIQLSRGTDGKWRLYIIQINRTTFFSLDKVLEKQKIKDEFENIPKDIAPISREAIEILQILK